MGDVEPNELARIRAQYRANHKTIKELSQSNPTKVGLARSSEFCMLDAEANCIYDPEPQGLVNAREALSMHYAKKGRVISPDNLFFCASTSEGYAWLFKLLCDPGDIVLIPKPGYPLFEHLAMLECVQTHAYPLEYSHPSGWHIDVASIGRYLETQQGRRAKAIIVINPNNPTGSYIRAPERAAILELCEHYKLALIVDEVFFDFPLFDSIERASFIGEERVLTFVLDGLSKRLGMPQMKLGWICVSGPGTLHSRAKRRLELIADTFLSAGTPIMNALPRLLASEDAFQGAMRRRISENYAIYRSILEFDESPHRVLACQGGWTALVESPSYVDEEKAATLLLSEKGIAVQPGYFFDMERGVHFAFSLILPQDSAAAWSKEYRDFFEDLNAR